MNNTGLAAADITSDLAQAGFAVVPRVLDDTRCDLLAAQVQSHAASGAGSRRFLEQSWVRALADELRRHSALRGVLPVNSVAGTVHAVR